MYKIFITTKNLLCSLSTQTKQLFSIFISIMTCCHTFMLAFKYSYHLFFIKDWLSIPRVRLHISVLESWFVLMNNVNVAKTTSGMEPTAMEVIQYTIYMFMERLLICMYLFLFLSRHIISFELYQMIEIILIFNDSFYFALYKLTNNMFSKLIISHQFYFYINMNMYNQITRLCPLDIGLY